MQKVVSNRSSRVMLKDIQEEEFSFDEEKPKVTNKRQAQRASMASVVDSFEEPAPTERRRNKAHRSNRMRPDYDEDSEESYRTTPFKRRSKTNDSHRRVSVRTRELDLIAEKAILSQVDLKAALRSYMAKRGVASESEDFSDTSVPSSRIVHNNRSKTVPKRRSPAPKPKQGD